MSPLAWFSKIFYALPHTPSFNNNHQHSPWQLDSLVSVASAFIGNHIDENDLLLPIQEQNKVVDEVVSEQGRALKGRVNDVAQLE